MSTKRDYYEVLGVGREASPDDIRGAYRKIALKNHPDRTPGDAEAEARFKEAAEAYAVLSDPEKRQRYDHFGHAGVDGPSVGGRGFSNVQDIFSAFGDLFGGGSGSVFDQFFGDARGGRRRGASLRVDIELTLEEVATGTKRTIDVNRPDKCATCDGSGAKPGTGPKTCATCRGSGQITHSQGFVAFRQVCPRCDGAGTWVEEHCTACKGRGVVGRRVPIDLTIPPGIEEGHVERIAGQGESGERGGPSGDLVVVVHVKQHEWFRREGDNLCAVTRIRYRQAVLGDEVEIPTITGETVNLKIPPGTQPGERLRVRHQGLPRLDGYGRGHLLVEVRIDVPKKVTAEQQELLEKFDDAEHKKRSSGGKKRGIFEKVRDMFQRADSQDARAQDSRSNQ